MLKFLAVILLCVSACSTFVPTTLQSKRSTDLDARKIKRIAVLLPNGMGFEPKSQAAYTSTPCSAQKFTEQELSALLAQVHSTMASMPGGRYPKVK
jgi:hypothetical protein